VEALDEGERFLGVLKPILPESEALVVGIGGNRGEPACLRESFLEACKAAVSGPLAIGGKPPYLYKDLGVYRLLVDPISAREKISFCNDLIGPLIQHDLSYDTKLCQTLEVFLDTGSMRKAADALSIHYNTIKYRLSQIRRLLGTDLSEGKSRLAMHLALKVWALEKKLPTRSGD
jgi:purine catabolism regulator